jgi:hypothetical protein
MRWAIAPGKQMCYIQVRGITSYSAWNNSKNGEEGKMARIGTLMYLQQQLNAQNDFFAQYKALSDKDKETLKKWAEEEMDELGMVR